jgi:hypothetical protein
MQKIRRSTQLNLSFPYDWSNPNISDDALIINVLSRGHYSDICRICAYFGFDVVDRLASSENGVLISNSSLERMLANIQKGFDRAQSR